MQPSTAFKLAFFTTMLGLSVNAWAQIPCPFCWLPSLSISAGTTVVCEKTLDATAAKQQLIDRAEQVAQAQTLYCIVVQGESLPVSSIFIGEIHDNVVGRQPPVVAWKRLVSPSGTVLANLDEADSVESQPWNAGKLRLIFKRDTLLVH